MNLGAIVMEYEVPLKSVDCFGDSAVSSVSRSSMSTIFSSMRRSNGHGQITHFPLTLDTKAETRAPFTHCFTTPDASLSQAQIGASGRRAVWLEHNWEEHQGRVMRYERGKDGVHVNELISHYPDLPFTPDACSSLAFDEVSGRLCLSLNTGELYLLDFV